MSCGDGGGDNPGLMGCLTKVIFCNQAHLSWTPSAFSPQEAPSHHRRCRAPPQTREAPWGSRLGACINVCMCVCVAFIHKFSFSGCCCLVIWECLRPRIFFKGSFHVIHLTSCPLRWYVKAGQMGYDELKIQKCYILEKFFSKVFQQLVTLLNLWEDAGLNLDWDFSFIYFLFFCIVCTLLLQLWHSPLCLSIFHAPFFLQYALQLLIFHCGFLLNICSLVLSSQWKCTMLQLHCTSGPLRFRRMMDSTVKTKQNKKHCNSGRFIQHPAIYHHIQTMNHLLYVQGAIQVFSVCPIMCPFSSSSAAQHLRFKWMWQL